VLTPGVAYLMTYLLERVVDAGTAQGVREAGFRGPAAGKTGTTDDERDAWFVGFTPDVVAGVWVGRDDGTRIGLTGAQAAVPMWTDFVLAATRPDAKRQFAVPDDVVWRDVDPASGELASSYCPEVRRVPFLVSHQPETQCALHRPVWRDVEDDLRREGERAARGIRGWFGRVFR
jgi:penicillin-binding protein 1B